VNAENSSLNKSDSKVRTVCLSLYNKIDNLATKYTKHKTVKAAIDRILKPHIHDLLMNEIPEQELKQTLNECYNEIQDITNEIKKGRDVLESRKLNPKKNAKLRGEYQRE